MEYILCWAQLLLLSIDLPWSVVYISKDIHWGNLIFSDSRYQMQKAP